MKIYAIICGMLKDLIESAARNSPHEIVIDEIDEKLHSEPQKLKTEIQSKIDALKPQWDYVVLGFGLCGGALNGIQSREHTLVIPRCHDCISLLLGSKEKYSQAVKKYQNRCYWFTSSFYKQEYLLTKNIRQKKIDEYIEKYDEETAQYLIDIELEPLKNYTHLSLIEDRFSDGDFYKDARELAEEFCWQTDKYEMDDSFFNSLFHPNGGYDEDVFLTATAGKTVIQSFDSEKIIELKM